MLQGEARLGFRMDWFPAGKRGQEAKNPEARTSKKIQPQNTHWPERIKHKGKKTDPQIVQGDVQMKEVYTMSCYPMPYISSSCVYKQMLENYQLLLSSQSIPDSLFIPASTWRCLF